VLLTFVDIGLFQRSHRGVYDRADVVVTYVLLYCIAALEFVSACLVLGSGLPMAFTTIMLAWSVADFGKYMGRGRGVAARQGRRALGRRLPAQGRYVHSCAACSGRNLGCVVDEHAHDARFGPGVTMGSARRRWRGWWDREQAPRVVARARGARGLATLLLLLRAVETPQPRPRRSPDDGMVADGWPWDWRQWCWSHPQLV
jgi:hypothetical protein